MTVATVVKFGQVAPLVHVRVGMCVRETDPRARRYGGLLDRPHFLSDAAASTIIFLAIAPIMLLCCFPFVYACSCTGRSARRATCRASGPCRWGRCGQNVRLTTEAKTLYDFVMQSL